MGNKEVGNRGRRQYLYESSAKLPGVFFADTNTKLLSTGRRLEHTCICSGPYTKDAGLQTGQSTLQTGQPIYK